MAAAPATPADSPLTMEDVLASSLYRDLWTPNLAEGDPAFDFELPRLDAPGETARLSDFAGRLPVALVFGSYTWPPFRRQLGELERIRERFAGEVEFFAVYIKEAHPEEGWVLTSNREEGIAVHDPGSAEERAEVAESCAVRYAVRMPMLLDAMDNEVARQYGGWPDRLYLIGRDGRVAYQGGEGPWGFKPEELEAAIERELSLTS